MDSRRGLDAKTQAGVIFVQIDGAKIRFFSFPFIAFRWNLSTAKI